jgi:hypothetical protein
VHLTYLILILGWGRLTCDSPSGDAARITIAFSLRLIEVTESSADMYVATR